VAFKDRLKEAFAGASSFREDMARQVRADSWINAITGLGGSRDKSTRSAVAALCVVQPVELEALYHGNDLAARIVDAVVDDALRGGFSFPGVEGLDDALRAQKAGALLKEARKWGRLYGMGAILIGSDGPMDEPLDLDTMGPDSLRYLMVLDRQSLSIADHDEDPESETYGEPRTFRLQTMRGESQLIHASRLIQFGGALTSERIKTRNEGFDLSVLQRPSSVLRDTDQSWRSVMLMIQDMSQAVFAIDGLIDMIAEGEKDTMLARMEVVDMARSVARAVVIDAEAESFTHQGAANIGGVEPVLSMVFQRLASAAGMPLTKLMGMSPGGMNATGESDTRHWYDSVQAERDEGIEDGLLRLARVVAADAGIAVGDDLDVDWPSLWQPSPAEQADLDKKEAETDKIRIDSGVLEPEEVTLAKLQDDPLYADVIDFKAREEALAEPEPEPILPVPGLEPPQDETEEE